MVRTKSVRFSEKSHSSSLSSPRGKGARYSPDLKPEKSILIESQPLTSDLSNKSQASKVVINKVEQDLQEQETKKKADVDSGTDKPVLITNKSPADNRTKYSNKNSSQQIVRERHKNSGAVTQPVQSSADSTATVIDSTGINPTSCQDTETSRSRSTQRSYSDSEGQNEGSHFVFHYDPVTKQHFRTPKPKGNGSVSVRVYQVEKNGRPHTAPPVVIGKELAAFCKAKSRELQDREFIPSSETAKQNIDQTSIRDQLLTENSKLALTTSASKPAAVIGPEQVKSRYTVGFTQSESKDNHYFNDTSVTSQHLTDSKPLYSSVELSGNQGNAMSLMMENQEFQDLDRRLSVHLQKVQQMRQTPDNITSTGFLDAIKILEEELFNMKQLYERELIQCRRMADDRSREKAHFAIQVEKLTGELSDMEERYKLETEQSQKLHEQLNAANIVIAEKEAMIRETNAMLNGPVSDLERLRREQDSITKESETIKSRYETESQLRHEAEDKIHQLEQKLEFDAKLQREEVHDLNDRLQTAANTIMALEAKIREITDSDKTLSEMLRQVHDAADAEIRRYQDESVQEYNRHIRALKCQIDEDSRKMDSMNQANENLLAQIEELTKRIRALEGQIASLEHQKGSIEDILRDERATSRTHIQNLEDKLRDLQDTLFIKMREINASRDAQVSMKAEIEGFRTLLEDEERRLRLTAPVSTSLCLGSTMPGTTAGVYSTNAGATTGPVFLPPPAEPVESPKTSSQPLGPIRARSAPASSVKARTNLVSSSLGQGKDYFDDMFRDLKRTTVTGIPKLPSPPPQNAEVVPPSSPQQAFMPKQVEIKPTSVKTHDYNTYSSSATGDLRILEVHPEGKYVRLVNTANKDYDIGGYLLEQMVGGHPVVVYRFPPRTRFDGNGTVTIWSSTADHKMHDPPSNFVWKEQQKWGTGPECTTILCKPNGQAIAWTTAAHRLYRDLYDSNSSPDSAFHDGTVQNGGQEELTELEMNINAPKPDPVFLRREKTSPPSLAAQKHPFGNAPSSPPHTHTGQVRVQTYGNDNSSVNRQSRSQGSRPDPIPGAPYAGASAQRMGSAMLRKYNITGSGSIANKAGGNMRYGMPSPFTSPLQQDFARSHDTRATALVRY